MSKRTQAPIIVVHSLAHAVAALRAATEAHRPVVLLSAPGAGIYAGPGWFKALVTAAHAEAPTAARCSAILDCGDDAGAAQAALHSGVGAVIFTGRPDVAERLAGIAVANGVRLLTARPVANVDLVSEFFADGDALRRRCLAAFEP